MHYEEFHRHMLQAVAALNRAGVRLTAGGHEGASGLFVADQLNFAISSIREGVRAVPGLADLCDKLVSCKLDLRRDGTL